MFCDRCGTHMHSEQAFCAKCGKSGGTVPMMPVKGRISGHVRMLGIFWLALSAIQLLKGIAVLVIFNQQFGVLPSGIPRFVPVLLHLVGRGLIVAAVAGFVAAWGLLEKHPWGRTLALVCGAISLIEVPFGTALGIYTLWVLLPAKSEAEYHEISRSAAA
jgi:hypothetical protein